MSIKEALYRKEVKKPGYNASSRKVDVLSEEYCRAFREAQMGIYRESGVIEMLKELVEIIKPKFGDAMALSTQRADFISLSVEWNFGKEIQNAADEVQYLHCDKISITAYPWTGMLKVAGGSSSYFDKATLRSSREPLEDAIADAYGNPSRYSIHFLKHPNLVTVAL